MLWGCFFANKVDSMDLIKASIYFSLYTERKLVLKVQKMHILQQIIGVKRAT